MLLIIISAKELDHGFCRKVTPQSNFSKKEKKKEIWKLSRKIKWHFAKGGTGVASFQLDRPGWKDHCSVQVSHFTIDEDATMWRKRRRKTTTLFRSLSLKWSSRVVRGQTHWLQSTPTSAPWRRWSSHPWLREASTKKYLISFGHCPFGGGGLNPCQDGLWHLFRGGK